MPEQMSIRVVTKEKSGKKQLQRRRERNRRCFDREKTFANGQADLAVHTSMSHSNNPYHQRYIQVFSTYVGASANSHAHEIMQHLLALIDQRIVTTKVQFDVDEPSMKKVKSKSTNYLAASEDGYK